VQHPTFRNYRGIKVGWRHALWALEPRQGRITTDIIRCHRHFLSRWSPPTLRSATQAPAKPPARQQRACGLHYHTTSSAPRRVSVARPTIASRPDGCDPARIDVMSTMSTMSSGYPRRDNVRLLVFGKLPDQRSSDGGLVPVRGAVRRDSMHCLEQRRMPFNVGIGVRRTKRTGILPRMPGHFDLFFDRGVVPDTPSSP
jgi:hypothetical protein